MFLSNLRHDNHEKHVLVDCLCGLTEDRCTFELVRCNLIMSGLKLDAEFVCFSLEIFHECFHAARNGSEIVVCELLVFGGCVSDYCPVAELEIRTGIVKCLIHKEILLLQTDIDRNRLYGFVEQVCN